ncbi:MAG: YggS family pyridoxal phosphate-dependent enzyme [Desulfohalobiaceae bacterium]|nr:YggS family pyridoxal phosphate-dependent enzyme [Desulfohalobiaceae bacterium]
MNDQTLVQRWRQTLDDIEEAARKAGRDPARVSLVAVSKLHPYQSIAELVQAGQLDFGENYVQEALEKQAEEGTVQRIRWHFLGRLQTNKARFLAGRFHLIHSLDRLKMARALNSKSLDYGVRQPVLIQVNLAEEEQKGGAAKDDLSRFAGEIHGLEGLKLRGLMCMPPFFDDGEQARPYFSRLRKLKEVLERDLGIDLPHLSMGMSGDYAQAIAEGATLVRIGTRIFGPRP